MELRMMGWRGSRTRAAPAVHASTSDSYSTPVASVSVMLARRLQTSLHHQGSSETHVRGEVLRCADGAAAFESKSKTITDILPVGRLSETETADTPRNSRQSRNFAYLVMRSLTRHCGAFEFAIGVKRIGR